MLIETLVIDVTDIHLWGEMNIQNRVRRRYSLSVASSMDNCEVSRRSCSLFHSLKHYGTTLDAYIEQTKIQGRHKENKIPNSYG